MRAPEPVANHVADHVASGRMVRPDTSRWQQCAVMRDISRGNGIFSADGKFRCGSPLDPRCAECINRFGPFET
jgi:hypothetical protein